MTDHSQIHHIQDEEDPVAGPLWMVGILGFILLNVVMLGLIAIYHDAANVAEEREVVNQTPPELAGLRSAQEKRLATAHLDEYEDETALVIPIDKAMQLVANEYAGSGQ